MKNLEELTIDLSNYSLNSKHITILAPAINNLKKLSKLILNLNSNYFQNS